MIGCCCLEVGMVCVLWGVRSPVRVGVVGAGGFASFLILKRLNTDLRQRGVEERRRVA